MQVREAVSADAGGIADLFGQLGYPADAGQIAARLDRNSGDDLSRTLVAETEQGVVGVAVVHVMAPLHVPSPWALLSALVVDEACRSAGTGAALLRAVEGFAAQCGCVQLELSSNPARTRAHRFYERHGYREKRMRFVKTFTATRVA